MRYLSQVGEEGCRKQPKGVGPHKFVSHTPVEAALEVNPAYWRRVPSVKRLIMERLSQGGTGGDPQEGRGRHGHLLEHPDAEIVTATSPSHSRGYPMGSMAGTLYGSRRPGRRQ
jgi:hypothetical protein